MSRVEEFKAAIDELTGLKEEMTPGPWSLDHRPATDEHFIMRRFEFFGPQVEQVASGLTPDDASLLLTLSRTIDAQLTILRSGLNWAELDRDGKVPDFAADNELALARAINGVTS